jgi:osmotically-inducible protein OsmY
MSFWLLLACAVICGCAGNPAQESTGEYIDSAVLTAKVKAKLASVPETNTAAINVETFKGVVQLSGFVATQDVARRAEQIAASVPGVKRVENKLTVTVGVGSVYLSEAPVCRTLGY